MKKDIENIVKFEGEKNNQNIQNFEEQLKAELHKIKDEDYTKFELGSEKAYEGLDQSNIKLEHLGTELK
jgi:hypothetical protein